MVRLASTLSLRWRLLVTASGLVLLSLCFLSWKPVFLKTWRLPTHLETIELPGFCNHGNIHMLDCESARHTGRVDVQRSFPLLSNLTKISESLMGHPMIRHSASTEDPEHAQEMGSNRYWSQFTGSGVWLPRLQVYFVVSRVVYTRPGTYWPAMSFLRGQLYDQSWKHLDNYTISWAGREITFPTIFQIPAVWWEGGSFFGPEDPRVILENAEGAEPVIVFNMILDAPGNPRAMWLHRPFSDVTIVLTIRREERKSTEKNWAPFFHNDDDSDSNDDIKQAPTTDLHFIYSLHPLRILKCSMEDGACDWIFQQQVPPVVTVSHEDPHGEMGGGTNFVRVPVRGISGLRFYAGFPRTHLNFCNTGATYRPELVLLAGIGTSFHIAFASAALTFHLSRTSTACNAGRMLIPGGVLRWDYAHRQDKLDLLLSVSDAENRVVQIYGLLSFIRRIPYFTKMRSGTSLTDKARWNFPWSVVGNEVLQCSVEAAANASRIEAGREQDI